MTTIRTEIASAVAELLIQMMTEIGNAKLYQQKLSKIDRKVESWEQAETELKAEIRGFENRAAAAKRRIDALEAQERAESDLIVNSRSSKMDANKRPLTVQVVIKSPPGQHGKRASVTRHLRLVNGRYVGKSLFGDREVFYDIDSKEARIAA